MADREVTVRLNVQPGSNQAGAALREQSQAAEELARRLGRVAELQERIGRLEGMRPGAASPVGRRLQVLREQLEAADPSQAPGPQPQLQLPRRPSATLNLTPAPEPPGPTQAAVPLAQPSEARRLAMLRARPPEGADLQQWQAAFDAMVAQEQEARARARRRSLANLATAKITGEIPQEEIQRVKGGFLSQLIGGPRSQLGGLVRGVVTSQLTGAMRGGAHPTGNPLAGVSAVVGAFSSLPGPIGAVASGLSLATAAAGFVVSAFFRVRDSSESLIAAQQQLMNDLRQGRQSGLATPEGLQRILTPTEYAQLATRQQGGDQAGAAQVVAQAEARLRAQAQGAGNGALRVALANQVLDQTEEYIRSPVYRMTPSIGMGGPATYNRSDLRRYRLRQAGLDPELFGAISNEDMTPAQRRELAALAGGPGVRAQTALQNLRNIQAAGIPNLTPGAPNLADLPNIFRSQQQDPLRIHEDVQRDLVRDQRQEAQFQAQMELWIRIQRDIATLAGNAGAGGGAWAVVQGAAQGVVG